MCSSDLNLPDPIMRARLSQLPGKVVFPSDLPSGSQSVAPGPKRKGLDQTWAVVFTSGTSGSPKGVAISGSAFCASAHGHVVASGLAKATWLLNLPLYHVGGLSVLTRAFFLDSDICIGSSRFSSEESARWIRSGRVEGVSLVSTTLKRLLDLKDLSFSHLKIALLGGGPCPQSLSREALARGVPLRLTYGMTETASQIATERKQLSGLEPLEGVELQISYAGEILVKSPSLASGFFQNGVFVPLSLVDGFFATGDLGELHASRLQVFGRKSEQIITGGKKVSPLELDEALQEDRKSTRLNSSH